VGVIFVEGVIFVVVIFSEVIVEEIVVEAVVIEEVCLRIESLVSFSTTVVLGVVVVFTQY
jgi:hypothetical protein